MIEASLGGGLTDHVDYEPHYPGRPGIGQREKASRPRQSTLTSALGLEVPRDRAGTYEPAIVPRHQRRIGGFDESVICFVPRA